jgi:inner membrane protein
MDSITHIALGACMGEAFAGKKLGHKALIWGAVAQSFPDIDFITSFWMDTSSTSRKMA